jgi:biopolymer transport protein ExbD
MSQSWKVVAPESSKPSKFKTAQEVLDAVVEGYLEPSDFVKGPGEKQWVAIELHPQFAEVVEDLNLDPVRKPEESTSLDMNPLIDVCLVLLIFFILTTTYVELRHELPAPPSAGSEMEQAQTQVIKETDLKKFTLRVVAKKVGTNTEIRIQDQVVTEDNLESSLLKFVRDTGIRKLAVEVFPGVSWGTFVAIQDAASGAGIEETIRIDRPKNEIEPK